ncbi:MAG: ORF6N domain-containing protein [bacterium]
MKRKIKNNSTVILQQIDKKIYLIRNTRVMLDSDLAEIFGVNTKRLNEQVKRNIDRFPSDFMFILTGKEFDNLKSQFATSSWGGRRKLPFVFTEFGALMLATVLNSPVAIRGSIQVVRAFTLLKQMLESNKKFDLKLKQLEGQVSDNTIDIKTLFDAIRKLMNPIQPDKKRIGFKE